MKVPLNILTTMMLVVELAGSQSSWAEVASTDLDPPPTESQQVGAQPAVIESLIKKKEFSRVSEMLSGWVKRHPDELWARLALAEAQVSLGQRVEAILTLKNGLDLANVQERVLIERRIRVLSTQFLSNDVAEAYQRALSLARTKNFRDARADLEKILKKEPEHLELKLALLQLVILENDLKAIQDQLRSWKPESWEYDVFLWLGRGKWLLGNREGALLDYQQAQQLHPEWELPALWLSEAYWQRNQKKEAILLLEKQVAQFPYQLAVLVRLAEFRLEQDLSESAAWSARKDLQLAESRRERFEQQLKRREQQLPLITLFFSSEFLKQRIEETTRLVDARLKSK